MEKVRRTRQKVVLTKRGVPVAKLVPADPPTKNIFGCMRGTVEIVGDIEAPLYTAEEWKEFERQRDEQWDAWDKEYAEHGTIGGKKTVGLLAAERARKRKLR
jgi:antitoxin (DNA-binding transcriptional repressor) of toxin-antitoxin stability system